MSSGGIGPEEVRWIDDDRQLETLIDALTAEPRYAMDTEFHRERTFFPQLALVQFAWESEAALVDPLAVDIRALSRLFASPAWAVMHAAQQDIDVLTHAVGAVPDRLYDTQLAAGFLGHGSPSLSALLQREIGVTPAKGDRLTDWLRRPLSTSQREYAVSDVAFLLDVHDRLAAKLHEVGRSAWVEEACEELRQRPVSGAAPEHAWLRLKDARTLRPRARALAQAVAAWRERRAMELDLPVRHVLPDLAVLGISQRHPRTAVELAQARGVDERFARSRPAAELLEALARSEHAEPPEVPKGTAELDRSLRPAVTLISAWVSQVARDERLDTELLATRSDITALLSNGATSRLRIGWRAELLGDGIAALLSGRSGLTFDGNGQLRLIAVAAG
ncbi:MAG: HRDC domain-containing protein [Actinomycetota bacterium]|nr:HRDC domain-containing protein [Actinomycetota bacterium]